MHVHQRRSRQQRGRRSGTTVTTAADTPDEVVSDTLPFTGPYGGDMLLLTLLAIVAGGAMLYLAARREDPNTQPTDHRGWSSM